MSSALYLQRERLLLFLRVTLLPPVLLSRNILSPPRTGVRAPVVIGEQVLPVHRWILSTYVKSLLTHSCVVSHPDSVQRLALGGILYCVRDFNTRVLVTNLSEMAFTLCLPPSLTKPLSRIPCLCFLLFLLSMFSFYARGGKPAKLTKIKSPLIANP